MNRAILARVKAKQATVVMPVAEDQPKKKALVKIAMKDPESGQVVKEFDDIKQAVAEGFNLPNIVGAIKGNKKYKGYLWTEVNQ